MKLSALTLSMVATTLPCSLLYAGGLDRTGQSMSAFLQAGNYAELNIAAIAPDVKGVDLHKYNTGNMAESHTFTQAAIKIQANENVSLGLLYDQPYGADTLYQSQNDFVATNHDVITQHPANGSDVTMGMVGASVQGGTSVEVNTQTLSFIMGYQPNQNWNIYAGPVYQTVEGIVQLRGQMYSVLNGYDLDSGVDGDWGFLVGAAYQIPDIALKASVTYRSEIEHNIHAEENIALADSAFASMVPQLSAINAASTDFAFSTPQSVNIDLQTGIMENTIAFAHLRWVDWSNFTVRPNKFDLMSKMIGAMKPELNKKDGFNLIDYQKDQISATVGIGRKFSDQWAANVSVGYDTGAGNPVTTLGPIHGSWSLGTGVRFSPEPNYFVGAGVKYFWLGDADAVTGAHTPAGKFSGNHALAYGLTMGYSF